MTSANTSRVRFSSGTWRNGIHAHRFILEAEVSFHRLIQQRCCIKALFKSLPVRLHVAAAARGDEALLPSGRVACSLIAQETAPFAITGTVVGGL